MARRGPYRRDAVREQPPAWRKTFLREWRELRGLAQDELAKKAKVSIALISQIEAQISGYSAESLHKLAAALEVAPGMIVSVDPSRGEYLWQIIAEADDEEREEIAQLAEVVMARHTRRAKR